MKKKILFLLPLLATAGLYAQLTINTPIQLYNTSCGYYDPVGIHVGPATNPPANNYMIVNGPVANSYGFVSPGFIHFAANSSSSMHIGANSGSSGNFHAQLLNQDLDVAFLPADINLNAISKFSKVEMGVDLSTIPGLNFDGRASAFLTDYEADNDVDYKPGTGAYNTAYQNGQIINPYDPDHISVDAVFFRPSSPNQDPLIRYGFYYKNYNRLPPSNLAGWALNTTDPDNAYEFRIRMAPDEVGLWTGFINIWVDGAMLPQTYYFSFNVVASSNPGYVMVDHSNNRYLKFSGDGSTFFPVGDNYWWPLENFGILGGLNLSPGYGANSDPRMFRFANTELTTYLDKLSGQATGGGGGNATRLGFMPWGFHVEWEKLNNYDSRQIEMWELDTYISMMEQRGVYTVFCFGNSGELGWESSSTDVAAVDYSHQWDNNPYNDHTSTNPATSLSDNLSYASCKGIAGLDDPKEFFTDPVAKSFYKKRLRYIVSRWGYSTAISMWELIGETDGAGGIPGSTPALNYEPYFDDLTNTFAQDLSNWHDEMLGYIRHTLKDPHANTASFLGSDYRTNDPNEQSRALLLWNLPNLDIISGHIYSLHENGIRYNAEYQLPTIFPVDKPVFDGETDVWDFVMTENTSDWENHNRHWASALSGKCMSGLSWTWPHYYIAGIDGTPFNYTDPNDAFRGEYENNYKAVRTFVGMIDFQNYEYDPGFNVKIHPTGTPIWSPYETFYLRNTTNSTVYGWTHNRSFNRWTVGNFLNDYTENSITYSSSANVISNQPTAGDAGAFLDYNPLDPANGPAYNQNNYVGLFGQDGFNGPTSFGIHSNYVEGMDAGADYQVDWYWTWGLSGGQYAGYSYSTVANPTDMWMWGSTLYFPIPPTGLVNGDVYPGDWAFVITKLNPRHAQPTAGSTSLPLTAQPNPSNGIFTLRSGLSETPATIEVYALDGRFVLREEVARLDGHTLDLGKQPDGVYLLDVTRNGQTNHLKLVKTQ